ncbi:hypothetical protein GCM10010094_12520 [Streptomyces flaveus]|uniref:Uncharacterized protein n=1 Tax=Streptomyces flaveus TaxID=66370 RepID=A0A917V9P7_9ACTN|nr:hypothetical protein GCM10010094_12520 [Streptomyces flaveus]
MDTEPALLRGQHGGMRAVRHILERIVPHAEGAGRPEASSTQPGAAPTPVTSPGQPLEAGQEALGGRWWGYFREYVLQSSLLICFGLALRAGGEVGQDALARLMTELPVHQGGESVSQVLLCRRRT